MKRTILRESLLVVMPYMLGGAIGCDLIFRRWLLMWISILVSSALAVSTIRLNYERIRVVNFIAGQCASIRHYLRASGAENERADGSKAMKQASDRLKKVLEIGDTLALFPVLKDWPTAELQALLEDVEWYTDVSYAAIQKAWEKTAMEPSLFFNAENAKLLDRARDEKRMEVVMIASEICSVAIFYLSERGIKVDPGE